MVEVAGIAGLPECLTTVQVATLFSVSTRTVLKWAKEGRLPCYVSPSGRRMFDRERVRAMLAEAARSEGAS